MIFNFEDLTKLFVEIDNSLSINVEFYVIGGAMLLYNSLKESTKDVDIIVSSQNEFFTIQKILKTNGFDGKIPTFEYKQVDLSQIFVRDDYRLDLFHSVVCKGFSLTPTMKKRALLIKEFKNLKIFLCAHEDVFLFKTFTQRDGDIDDCLSLAQKQRALNWQVVLDEVQDQIQISGRKVWITYVAERLELLEERGLTIPILRKIETLCEEYFEDYEKRHPH